MNKILLLFLTTLIFCNKKIIAQNENDIKNYIEQYKQYAMEEQKRTGVPASITLAQGIHETAAGTGELARMANNHFGIKCKSNWTGETYNYDDDKKQECFRKYMNPLQSYIDHSDFLKGSPRYASLFELEITDYAGWAQGLKKAGYATNPLYARKLTEMVERYDLQQYTYDALKGGGNIGEVVPNKDSKMSDLIDDPNQTYKGLKGFWAKKGDNVQDLATRNNIKSSRILEFNELHDEVIPDDMFVFTQKKKRIGTVEFHQVKEGENMYIIAQKEAMALDNLYLFNNLKKGDEPMNGEILSLQYKSYNTPKILKAQETKNEILSKVETIENTSEATVNKEDIRDIEKAKKVESILTGKSIEKSEIILPKEEEIQRNKETKLNEEVVKNTPIEERKIEIPKPKVKPQAPKRTYNEPGVDSDVKELKEKFDNIVYRPFERKVSKKIEIDTKITPTATGIKKEATTPKANVENVKDTVKKTIIAKENPNIQKTNTGIKRDAKKIEEENKLKKEEDDKKAKEQQSKNKAKEVIKKEITKKETIQKKESEKSKKHEPQKVEPTKKKTEKEKEKPNSKTSTEKKELKHYPQKNKR